MRSRRLRVILALPVALLLGAGRASAAAPGVFGLWLTDSRDGVIEIYHCGAEICGRLVGMQYEGPMPTDWRHQGKCGQVFIWGMKPDGDGADDGHIVNPNSGSIYSARLTLLGPDTLRLRGYLMVSLLGGSRTWTRYHGPPIGPACHLANGL